MFRIRKVPDARAPGNQTAIAEAQQVIRSQLPGLRPEEVDDLPAKLADPIAHRFVTELFVAEDARGHVRAAAVLMHDPELAFAYLDLIAATPSSRTGGGVGGALYDRIRQEAAELGATGLYFECLPDDSPAGGDTAVSSSNQARLKFYERFGARPIIGTAYQEPVTPGDVDMPFMVFDGLGQHDLPDADRLRAIVRAILERKYADLCPPEYVELVVGSIVEGGYHLRPPRYVRKPTAATVPVAQDRMPLIVNDRHDIHHVRERGYVESPVRISTILSALEPTGLFARQPARHFADRWVREVHDGALVDYVRTACAETPEKASVYPYVFPVRNAARRPRERSVLAGYWCIDTFTPINRNAWPAARAAADCALTAAEEVLNGARAAYALVRPPGHHAERRTFGGFCYLCNGAIAAHFLSQYGRVAILDIDYHHGNGQQDIFYERSDVLTVSIHGDPAFAYPYFTGFREESGRGDGAGFNTNIPLPEVLSPAEYRVALEQALTRIRRFAPDYLVLSLGFDTGRGDPTGTWQNSAQDFRAIGETLGRTGWPIAVIQEGGYRIRTLGANAAAFFQGLAAGIAAAPAKVPAGDRAPTPRRVWRSAVRAEDPARIRRLVAATGRFSAEEEAIAEELAQERIEKGRRSGYEFELVHVGDRLIGYACYGPVPGSETGWDLYWIAVDPDMHGGGLGTEILARVEADVRRRGGRTLYADTSSSPGYAATRAFYDRKGFRMAADFPDFYRPGDGKVVYSKELSPAA